MEPSGIFIRTFNYIGLSKIGFEQSWNHCEITFNWAQIKINPACTRFLSTVEPKIGIFEMSIQIIYTAKTRFRNFWFLWRHRCLRCWCCHWLWNLRYLFIWIRTGRHSTRKDFTFINTESCIGFQRKNILTAYQGLKCDIHWKTDLSWSNPVSFSSQWKRIEMT